MPDPIQAPQGQEQKLVFRNEDERQKAYNQILDEPPETVTDLEAWKLEQDAIQDRIDMATIDPNYSGDGQAPTSPAAPQQTAEPSDNASGDWYKPSDWTFQQGGQTITIGRDEIPEELRSKGIKNSKDLILDTISTHRYAETKKQEYQQSLASNQQQLKELQDKIKDYDKKIEELSNKPATPSIPGSTADVPNEQEVASLQTELDNITKQLETTEEDDLSPEALALQRKAIRIQAKLMNLKDKSYNVRFQTFETEREQVRRDSAAAQKRQQDEERIQKEAARAQEAKSRMVKAVETFANNPDSQLKLSKPFAQIEKEYENWATDIAATYFNIPQDQVQGHHAEVAVQQFLNRTPAFITKLTEQGKLNKTPTDLRKYLINTELYMMMQGQELDATSGQWRQNEWRLPDMETAYERWKRNKGLKYQDEVAAANKAEEELLRVITPTGIAEQVPAQQGPQQQRDMSKLSLPQAENILQDLEKKASMSGYSDLEEWIENKRRKSPGDSDVELYDQADKALFSFKE